MDRTPVPDEVLVVMFRLLIGSSYGLALSVILQGLQSKIERRPVSMATVLRRWSR